MDDMDVLVYIENGELVIGSGESLRSAFDTELTFQFSIPDTFSVDERDYPVTTIGDFAFYKTNVNKICIPKSIKNIKSTCFERCAELTSIEVDPSNDYFSSTDNILTSKDKTILYYFSHESDQGSIPSTVTVFSDACFSSCPLKTFQFIPRYKSFGVALFSGCQKLNKVVMTRMKCRSIPERMFSGCAKLGQIELPGSIDYIGDYAFMGTKLKAITLNDRLYYLGAGAFMNTKLKKIDLYDKNITVLHPKVFAGCEKLERVQLPDVLMHIDTTTFLLCTSLMTVIYRGMRHFEDKDIFTSTYPKIYIYKTRYQWYQFCGIDVFPYDPRQDIPTFHSAQGSNLGFHL